MKIPNKILEFNIPQMLVILAQQAFIFLEWGRGTGKSTIIAWRIMKCVQQMPRSCGGLVGVSYQQILTRTLPSTIEGLERLGWYQGVHFVIGEKPPLEWPKAYQPPLKFNNYISFYNGSGLHLISQDIKGSGRGLNLDWVVGDEAALLDKENLDDDVLASNRGNINRFGDCSLHHSIMFCSTIPRTSKGRWIYQIEKEAIKNPEKILYLRASAKFNMTNLGPDWFKEMKRMLTDFRYKVEVLNERPKVISQSFYPSLDEDKHYYLDYNNDYYGDLRYDKVQSNVNSLGDRDIDSNETIIMGVDWGSRINCLCIAQKKGNTLKFVKEFYVKEPKILDHLFTEEFIPYFKHHKHKVINMYYDRNGNSRQANNSKTYAEQGEQHLLKAGWKVNKLTYGVDAPHELKFLLWNKILLEQDKTLPKVRINKGNCPNLIISMENAPAKEDSKGKIKKNKETERLVDFPQEESTHFSDAADVIVWGIYKDLINKKSEPTMPITIR